jgi:hypothetical protein
VAPLPSWPKLFSPQQKSSLLAIAQVLLLPIEMAVIVFPLSTPVDKTATGELDDVVVPLPNWPDVLLPQQNAFPSATAHA